MNRLQIIAQPNQLIVLGLTQIIIRSCSQHGLRTKKSLNKLRETKGNYGVNNIFEYCKKLTVERSEVEINYTRDYLLNRVEFFVK